MPRTPFVAGNWKLHKTIAEAEAFIGALLPLVSSSEGVDVAICPPFTALQAMVDSTRGSRVEVYAQNIDRDARLVPGAEVVLHWNPAHTFGLDAAQDIDAGIDTAEEAA